jgi:hypothetical protein
MTAAGFHRRIAATGALAVLLAACNGDGGTGPNGATSVVAASPILQTSTTGIRVADPPAVRVTNRDGEPVAGVPVAFKVTAGGGLLRYSAATTDATGFATAGVWELGTTPGQNTVVATVEGLPPVTFNATAQARRAASMVATSAVSQPGVPGTPVIAPPIVRVYDQTGQPMSGITVTFTVTAGGGTVGSPTATTNTAGEAAAGSWTLGPAQGTNTVTATTAGVPPVIFNATSDPCLAPTWYVPLTTIAAALTTSDCRLSAGYYLDLYEMDLWEPVSFRMTSTEVDAWLELYDENGDLVALNDDADGSNAQLNVFALPIGHFLVATTFDPGELGSYTLSSSTLNQAVGCGEYWVVPQKTLNASVASTDCEAEGYYSDLYFIVAHPGQPLRFYMQSTTFDPVLELYDAISGELVARNDDGGGGTNAQIDYTATELTILAVNATTWDVGATGAYQISVHRLGGDSPAAALRSGPPSARVLDAAGASASRRSGQRKAAAALRGAGFGVPRLAPTPRVKPAGTR